LVLFLGSPRLARAGQVLSPGAWRFREVFTKNGSIRRIPRGA